MKQLRHVIIKCLIAQIFKAKAYDYYKLKRKQKSYKRYKYKKNLKFFL